MKLMRKVRRLFALLLCTVMLGTLIPAVSLHAFAAEAEGDWNTYRHPEDYADDVEDLYTPAPGYEYTSEGFTTLSPDWTNDTPYFTVQTKEAQPLKEGFYMEMRVDNYSYGGESGDADHWISFNLSDREKVAPGSIDFGNNWMSLIRGAEGGEAVVQSFLTTMTTEQQMGKLEFLAHSNVYIPQDNQGRGHYTFEITWDGSAYDLKVCGVSVVTKEISDALQSWVESGEYYVGVTFHTSVPGGDAKCTILKAGKNAETATVPTGTDSREPEQDILCGDWGEGLPPPANEPALLFDATKSSFSEDPVCSDCTLTAQGDRSYRVEVTGDDPSFTWKIKRSLAYNAEDYPVFGILLRNFRGDSGTLWYAAGEVTGAQNDCTLPFSIYDGLCYGEEDEYVLIPVDMTGLWEGRINNIRLDFVIGDEEAREFDICFAGMFRSAEEARAYVEDSWMSGCIGAPTDSPDETISVEPITGEVVEVITEDDSGLSETIPETTAQNSTDAEDKGQAVQDILQKYGCTGALNGGMWLFLIAAFVAARKKE